MKLEQAIFLASLPVNTKKTIIPDGWYQASIESADLKTTADGTGKYISFKFVLIDAAYNNQWVFVNVNIVNKNAIAESIGLGTLGRIMSSCGLDSIQDTDELIGAPMEIFIKKRVDEKYGESNDVKDFRLLTTASPIDLPNNAQSKNPYAQSATPKKAPWAK